MTTKLTTLCVASLIVLTIGCSPSAPLERTARADSRENSAGAITKPSRARPATVDDALVQFSLLSALSADDYNGGAPLRELLHDGDFGVGTFDRLDGEMIVLDGKIYQALADGTVREADANGATPFAAVKFFTEDGRIDSITAPTLEDLDQQLDERLPRRNSPYALKIAGAFAELTIRSVPAQSPPYEPLVDVVEHQVTWQHRNIRGTLVGLRCPAWVGTINVAGYHWHFLSDDRRIGGHVLQCGLEQGSLSYDECSSVLIRLPQSDEFQQLGLGEVLQQDVDKIERQRSRD